MLDQLTLQSFEPHVGSQFELTYASDETIIVALNEASAIGKEPSDGRRHAFALLFSGPADPPLEQQVCRLKHEQLDELEVFLVPVNQTEDGQRLYEAVFT